MGDRELLELAAKAARTERCNAGSGDFFYCSGRDKPWDLQANNGHALRLAVDLRLNLRTLGRAVLVRRTRPHPANGLAAAVIDRAVP